MQAEQASQTAIFTALLRAYHALTANPVIFNDTCAGALIGLHSDVEISRALSDSIDRLAQLGDKETAQQFAKRIEHSVCMRARLVDWHFHQMRSTGLEQLIILGAGLDSTAYRQADISNITVFEVDHPATQTFKQQSLTAAGIKSPDNLSLVPFDFEQHTLEQSLVEGGVDFSKVTLCSWLGVQMYLSADAISTTLAVIANLAKGSVLVTDFAPPAKYQDDAPDPLTRFIRIAEQSGEPFLSRFEPDELQAHFNLAGFSSSHFYSTHELVDLFLDGKRDAYSVEDDTMFLASARV